MKSRSSDDLETFRRAKRRWFRAFLAFVLVFWLSIGVAGGWLASHPRALGTFLGQIARGFDASGRGDR